jgi:hypothetical protein
MGLNFAWHNWATVAERIGATRWVSCVMSLRVTSSNSTRTRIWLTYFIIIGSHDLASPSTCFLSLVCGSGIFQECDPLVKPCGLSTPSASNAEGFHGPLLSCKYCAVQGFKEITWNGIQSTKIITQADHVCWWHGVFTLHGIRRENKFVKCLRMDGRIRCDTSEAIQFLLVALFSYVPCHDTRRHDTMYLPRFVSCASQEFRRTSSKWWETQKLWL